jgi:hypothetical protein
VPDEALFALENEKVERNYRENRKMLYNREVFTSEKGLRRNVAKHERRYNKKAKRVLNFKIPNEMVAECFSKWNTCLDR